MTDYRDQILEATAEAQKLKKSGLDESMTKVDLSTVVDSLGVPVVFRPLDNLWGGAITIEDKKGIIIDSNLPKYLQRFTLAHEIGHLVLEHENQVDNSATVNMRVSRQSDRPLEEVTADAFASELLASKEIIGLNAGRNNWNNDDLQKPEYIYQLSIRLGISFEATSWALVDHDVLDQDKAEDFKNNDGIVKKNKDKYLPNDVEWNPHADIWSLSKEEQDALIYADKEDLFIIDLEERASSGYKWGILNQSGAEVVFTEQKGGEKYGSFTSKKIGFSFPNPGNHSIRFRHGRQWSDESIEELNFSIDTRGGEDVGLPRNKKQAALSRGVA